MRGLLVLAGLLVLVALAPAVAADPVGVTVGRCGAVADPDDPSAAVGCGPTFACYVDADRIVRCYG
jgi:hypothetical protein